MLCQGSPNLKPEIGLELPGKTHLVESISRNEVEMLQGLNFNSGIPSILDTLVGGSFNSHIACWDQLDDLRKPQHLIGFSWLANSPLSPFSGPLLSGKKGIEGDNTKGRRRTPRVQQINLHKPYKLPHNVTWAGIG